MTISLHTALRHRLDGLQRGEAVHDPGHEFAYRAILGLQVTGHAGLIDPSSRLMAETFVLICRAAGLPEPAERATAAPDPHDETPTATGYRILDATLELIERGGLNDVTFSNVAALTGIGRGTLQSIFGTPQHMLADQQAFVVEEILDDLAWDSGVSEIDRELFSLTDHFYATSLSYTLAGISRRRIRARVDPELYSKVLWQHAAGESDDAPGLLATLAAIDSYYAFSPYAADHRPSAPRNVHALLEDILRNPATATRPR